MWFLLACTPDASVPPVDTGLLVDTADSAASHTGDTGDSGDPPSPLQTVFDEDDALVLELTAPNFGYDLSTDKALLTVEGTASGQAVTWSTSGGSSGTATGAEDWTASDIPLVVGDNVVTFVTTDGDRRAERMLRVSHTPDVPLASGLLVDVPLLLVGEGAELGFAVWTAGDVDAIQVGPADGEGDLREVWATLEPGEEANLWVGEATVQLDAAQDLELRAVATLGGAHGATPAVDVPVVEPLTGDQAQAHEALAEQVWDIIGDADAAHTLLGADPLVAAYGVHSAGGWYTTTAGITTLFTERDDGVRGGSGGPAAVGTNQPQPWTWSSAGRSGPPLELGREDALPTGTEVWMLEPFQGEFSTSPTPALKTAAKTAVGSCSPITKVEHHAKANATPARYAEALPKAGALLWDGHGQWGRVARVVGAGVTYISPPQSVVQTGVTVNAANDRTYRRQLRAGTMVKAMRKATQTTQSFNLGKYSLTGSWIRAQTRRKRMPGTLVTMLTCHGMQTTSLHAALRSAGAKTVWGFTHEVQAAYSDPMVKSYWMDLLAANNTGTAFDAVQTTTPDDTTTPAIPKQIGSRTMVLTQTETSLSDSGFESGGTAWTQTTGGAHATWSFGASIYGAEGAPEGSKVASALLDLDANGNKSFAGLEQQVCLGGVGFIRFKWAYNTAHLGSSSQPVQLRLVAYDQNGGQTELWKQTWTDLSLTSDGYRQYTGWQTATVGVPTAVQQQPVTLRWIAYSPSYDEASFALDAIEFID